MKGTENFNDPFWNLAQLFAWVLLRDKNLVHLASDNSTPRDTGPTWVKDTDKLLGPENVWQESGDSMKGTRLKYNARLITAIAWRKEMPDVELRAAPAKLRTTEKIIASINTDPQSGKKYEQAIEQPINNILQELRKKDGALKAYGLRNGKGDLIEIRPVDWAALQFIYDPDGAATVPVKEFASAGASFWSNLKFERQQILNIWRDPESQEQVENTKPEDKRTRIDRLRRDMEEAYRLCGKGYDATPHEILQVLRSFSGKPGYSIKSIKDDKTIIWSDTSGEPKPVSWKDFKRRCEKMRELDSQE